MGKNPNGNAQGITTDSEGNLNINISSNVKGASNTLIPPQSEILTEPFEVSKTGISLRFLFNARFNTGGCRIGIQYLSHDNSILETESNIHFNVGAEFGFEYRLKFLRFRLIIHNGHTSARTLKTLAISNNIEVEEKVSKNGVVAYKEITLESGETTSNFLSRAPVHNYAIVYFAVGTVNHDVGYVLDFRWWINEDSLGLDEVLSREINAISDKYKGSSSEWFEVKGNSIQAILTNNDSVERTYKVVIMGIG